MARSSVGKGTDMRTLIRDGLVITMDSKRRILKDAAVSVEGDSILSVGKTEEIESQGPFDRILQGRGKLIIPGLIYAHAHLTNEGPKGFVPDNVPALPWITDWIRPITKVLTLEDEYLLSLNAMVEMIKTGYDGFLRRWNPQES